MTTLRMPRCCPPLSVLALALAALTVLHCYNPSIDEGAFLCGTDGICPAGFTCANMRCWKGSPPDGSASPGDSGSGLDARPVCSPPPAASGVCDPVCQTGCPGAADKCTNTGGVNMCKPVSLPGDMLYDTCDQLQDNCGKRLVCLEEFVPDTCGGAHCYEFCRQDVDCGENSRCVGEVQDSSGRSLYKTCSPRGGNCNPTGTTPRCAASAPADRQFPAFACYIVSPAHADESVCECAGTIPEGQVCERTYECVPGNECIPMGRDVRCRRLCTPLGSPLLPPVTCPGLQTCQTMLGARRVGFCF
jgi:hypothetical protein